MKRIVLVLFGTLLVFSSRSQDNNLWVERNVSKYIMDTLYSQIDFCYSNKSDSVYVLWIEKDNVDSLSNLKKIRKHFFNTKGDMSLMQIILDGNVVSFTPSLFESFMKVIKPKESFTVSFIKKGDIKTNSDVIRALEKKIITVNANQISGLELEIDHNIDMFNFRGKDVTILYEWLK